MKKKNVFFDDEKFKNKKNKLKNCKKSSFIVNYIRKINFQASFVQLPRISSPKTTLNEN